MRRATTAGWVDPLPSLDSVCLSLSLPLNSTVFVATLSIAVRGPHPHQGTNVRRLPPRYRPPDCCNPHCEKLCRPLPCSARPPTVPSGLLQLADIVSLRSCCGWPCRRVYVTCPLWGPQHDFQGVRIMLPRLPRYTPSSPHPPTRPPPAHTHTHNSP